MARDRSGSAAEVVSAVDWLWLRSFVAVMEGGSLTAAARSLNSSQPTVGRHIRALEQRLGDTLFERQPRGLLPTARATDLYERSAAVEQAVTGLSASLLGNSPEPAGLVRITASVTLAVELLPSLIAPLLRQHDRIRAELLAEDDVLNLIRREADVAIRFVRPTQPEVVAVHAGEIAVGLYASADYLQRAGTPRRLAQVAQHTLVGTDDTATFVREFAARGIALEPGRIRLHSRSYLAQLAAIRAGVGIGAVQTWLAPRYPELVRVLPKVDVSRLPVWVATHDDFYRSRRIRVVFEHLVDRLKRVFS